MIAWYKFSDAANYVILGAQREAEARCTALGPEHLLLALLTLPEDAGDFLRRHGITAQEWQTHLPPLEPMLVSEPAYGEPALPPFNSLVPSSKEPILASHANTSVWGEIPSLTSQGKKILEFSRTEALLFQSPMTGPEHILLALLRLRGEWVGCWLEQRGITYEEFRTVVAQNSRESLLHNVAETALMERPSIILNWLCLLIPLVCWSPMLFADAVHNEIFDASLGFIVAAPVLGVVFAVRLLCVSKSKRLKSASRSFLSSFFLMVFTLWLDSLIHLT